jgi:hypothetical protein
VLPRIYSDRVKTTFHVGTAGQNFLCSIHRTDRVRRGILSTPSRARVTGITDVPIIPGSFRPRRWRAKLSEIAEGIADVGRLICK